MSYTAKKASLKVSNVGDTVTIHIKVRDSQEAAEIVKNIVSDGNKGIFELKARIVDMNVEE